jgi:hypothetical protein
MQKEFSDKSEETRVQINQLLKSFENEIFKNLEKKANKSEMQNQLNEKADLIFINTALDNKVNYNENESMKLNLEKLNREIVNKLDFNKFEAYMNDSRVAFDEMQKEISQKSTLRDVNLMLCKKADIEKVNQALIQVTEDLDAKCSIQQVNSIIFFI